MYGLHGSLHFELAKIFYRQDKTKLAEHHINKVIINNKPVLYCCCCCYYCCCYYCCYIIRQYLLITTITIKTVIYT